MILGWLFVPVYVAAGVSIYSLHFLSRSLSLDFFLLQSLSALSVRVFICVCSRVLGCVCIYVLVCAVRLCVSSL